MRKRLNTTKEESATKHTVIQDSRNVWINILNALMIIVVVVVVVYLTTNQRHVGYLSSGNGADIMIKDLKKIPV